MPRHEIFRHPQLKVSVEEVTLPDGSVIADWPIVTVRNYSNAVVCNAKGDFLIQEGYQPGAGRESWQMIGDYLEDKGHDPLATIQQRLLEIGYRSAAWQYLGSFVVDGNQHVSVGHFFLALDVEAVVKPPRLEQQLEAAGLRWVSRADAKRALLDGRISVMNYATNLLLALLAQERQAVQRQIDSFQENG